MTGPFRLRELLALLGAAGAALLLFPDRPARDVLAPVAVPRRPQVARSEGEHPSLTLDERLEVVAVGDGRAPLEAPAAELEPQPAAPLCWFQSLAFCGEGYDELFAPSEERFVDWAETVGFTERAARCAWPSSREVWEEMQASRALRSMITQHRATQVGRSLAGEQTLPLTFPPEATAWINANLEDPGLFWARVSDLDAILGVGILVAGAESVASLGDPAWTWELVEQLGRSPAVDKAAACLGANLERCSE